MGYLFRNIKKVTSIARSHLCQNFYYFDVIMKWVLYSIVMAMAMEKWVSWQQVKVFTL